MNTKQNFFYSSPITYTFLHTVAVIGLTIFATLFHYTYIVASLYITISSIIVYKQNFLYLKHIVFLLIISYVTTARINQQYNLYYSDSMWLHKPVAIKGNVLSIHQSSFIKNQTTLTISTFSIKNFYNKSFSNKKTISLFIPSAHCQNIIEGDQIEINNIALEQPPRDSDYERYLIKEGVWAIAHCKNQIPKIKKTNQLSLRQTCISFIHKNISYPHSLFYPLFLGQREKCITALKTQHQCVYWGAAHHMARSGIHLGVLFGLFIILFHYVHIVHWSRYILITLILFMYAYISFPSISFIRALLMILSNMLCKIFKKLPSTLHILTLVTIITLLYNPMQILFLDFQLSFGITYILIWFFITKNTKSIALH